ncbi:hypothetical protein [Intrasporangium sp.]|uniref:hypothetical protein n=1 Tax=Intrasporangium sp. TaxID=1925024 RepID=UPI003222090C
MLTPRHAITAGLVLVVLAVVLMTGGHGFWVVFPLIWFAGHRSCGGARHRGRCPDPRREQDASPADPADPPAPDPTRDRHEAFPGSH